MVRYQFDDDDLADLKASGISPEEGCRQLEIFQRDSAFVTLKRPCRTGDGIVQLSQAQLESCLAAHEDAAERGRFMKFVPASGAATRMFQCLYQALARSRDDLRAALKSGSDGTTADLDGFANFIRERRRFPFYHLWCETCRRRLGRPLEALLESGDTHAALTTLLDGDGLGYGHLPKALIPFHRHGDGPRTALEEHLVEAAATVRDGRGGCQVHFTLGGDGEAGFRELAERVRGGYQDRLGCEFQLSYSLQQRATDTIAVDLDNRPLRDASGRLLLRPAGHGALLENLNRLQGDLVFIKNIDNVLPDHLKATTVLWKKALGGLLVEVQNQVHALARQLETGTAEPLLTTARRFFDQWLLPPPSPDFADLPAPEQGRRLRERLLRPLRVCGVVANTGEPGGGPFWVRGGDGSLSLQIVEQAQVRRTDPEQAAIWRQATHFNPVDLVCAVRDVNGRCFDLHRFRDPEAVFITRKSSQGKELKALELPGLWNGAMAYWNTIFVEVPRITFNPVKTVNDLLRPEHQGQ